MVTSKSFRCYKSKWYFISFSLPVNLSSSLLLELELTKEISSLDTFEVGDANGKPFGQVNREGKLESGHEIKWEKEERNTVRRWNPSFWVHSIISEQVTDRRTFTGTTLDKSICEHIMLTGVWTTYRRDYTALMSHIEAIYHQVIVPPEDLDLSRFHWYQDGNLNEPLIEWKMFVASILPQLCGKIVKMVFLIYMEIYFLFLFVGFVDVRLGDPALFPLLVWTWSGPQLADLRPPPSFESSFRSCTCSTVEHFIAVYGSRLPSFCLVCTHVWSPDLWPHAK